MKSFFVKFYEFFACVDWKISVVEIKYFSPSKLGRKINNLTFYFNLGLTIAVGNRIL